MAEISKLSKVAIADVAKVDAVLKADIANINGLTIPSAAAPTPLCAFSVRLIPSALGVSGYSGPCCRVRRSSDNVEADVGFDSNDLFGLTSPITNTSDAQSYTDFADFIDHTGSPSTGFVRTWYDQSSNSRDGQETTSSRQAKIYDSGAILEITGTGPGTNSRPYLASVANCAYDVSGITSTTGRMFVNACRMLTDNNGNYDGAPDASFICSNNTSPQWNWRQNDSRINGVDYVDNDYATRALFYADFAGEHGLFSDRATGTIGAFTAVGFGRFGFRMPDNQEFLLYDDADAFMSTIETNMNNFFSLY